MLNDISFLFLVPCALTPVFVKIEVVNEANNSLIVNLINNIFKRLTISLQQSMTALTIFQ